MLRKSRVDKAGLGTINSKTENSKSMTKTAFLSNAKAIKLSLFYLTPILAGNYSHPYSIQFVLHTWLR